MTQWASLQCLLLHLRWRDTVDVIVISSAGGGCAGPLAAEGVQCALPPTGPAPATTCTQDALPMGDLDDSLSSPAAAHGHESVCCGTLHTCGPAAETPQRSCTIGPGRQATRQTAVDQDMKCKHAGRLDHLLTPFLRTLLHRKGSSVRVLHLAAPFVAAVQAGQQAPGPWMWREQCKAPQLTGCSCSGSLL